MIRTLAARLLFALAAACALSASTGVAVPPHDEEPGTVARAPAESPAARVGLTDLA